MAFEGLTEKISSAFKHLRSKGRLTESDIKEAMREIRMALLEADVNFKVAKDFIKAVTEKATDAEILEHFGDDERIDRLAGWSGRNDGYFWAGSAAVLDHLNLYLTPYGQD